MKGYKQAPRTCPVCSENLSLTRLSCDECGTEISGHFPTCEYCGLASEDRETLRVFLASRGNMKEVERHLNVSYPTARVRFDQILAKLGHVSTEEVGKHSPPALEVLESLAAGTIDVDEALKRIQT